MRTSEQRTADASLRSIAGTYRVTQDAEGWPIVPGRLGQIEYHDGGSLAVFTDRRGKLLAIPGIRRHQTGDGELRALFAPALLAPVAQAIRAYRRRSSDSAGHLVRHAYPSTLAGTDEPGSTNLV